MVAFAALMLPTIIFGQCAATTSLGSASNMLTMIRNSTNPIAADKNLNTIVLAHRNNAGAFGGSSGNIRYDVSTNGGTSWTNDIGPLNPTLTTPARYPNAVIYNPATNTVSANAYLGYLAATINSVTSTWNGYVTGVRKLNGTGNTETYNTPGNSLIPHSLTKGAPGIFWSVDAVYNGTLVSGFKIYKGTWNGSNDINWATNFTVTPSLNTAFNGTAQVGDYNIAFDPTGMKGWMSFLGHLSTGPANYAYYPIFYKTIDGGATWAGPIQVDINQFPCVTSILTGTNVLSTAFEHDLTVDKNGSPHMLTTICNGNNGYSVYFGFTHHVYDITSLSGVWTAYDLGNVNAGRGGWGPSTTNTVTMDMQPQISRTSDGSKIFFCWTDNTTYTLGAANQAPNLKGCALDMNAMKMTNIKDFTSCNGAINGLVYFPHIASEVLEPSTTSFKLAGAYAAFTTPNDPGVTSNLKFLDNLIFNSTDFAVNVPTVAVTINQGNSWLLCPTNTLGLSITGTYTQVLWNNGAITNSTSVSTGSNYIVAVRNGCSVGADTIAVANLTTNVTTPSICIGNSSTLTMVSNAFSYTWSVGNSTASFVVVSPTTTSVYSYTTTGTSCTNTQTVSVTVAALPTLTITGTPTVCAGLSVINTASGANTYTWSSGATTASASLSPPSNAVYTVTGTDLNNCVNTQTTAITVMSNPTVNVTGNNTVCAGGSSTLTASGAVSYTWNTSANSASIVAAPLNTTNYTVTGSAANSCTNAYTVNVIVNPNPTLTISGTATVCSGSTTTLTASGATSYSWNTGAGTASTAVNPSTTTMYTVTGTDANLCNSTLTINVSAIALPTISIVSNASLICSGNTATLSGTGATTYSWNTGASTSVIAVSPTISTTYTLNGTNASGCSNSTAFTQSVSGCVGVNKLNTSSDLISVYPNPSNGTFIVKSDIQISLIITNELGQIVMTLNLTENTPSIEVKNLAKGIYFITGNNSSDVFKSKLIVN